MQFDLYLPEGITVSTDANDKMRIEVNSSRTTVEQHTISSKQHSDGSITVVCSSAKGTTFTGTDGAIVDVYLDIADNVSVGDYQIMLKNAVMSNSNNTYYSEDVSTSISVNPTYKLSFIADDTVILDTMLAAGEEIVAPQIPEKVGFSSSWETYPTVMPEEAVRIMAIYTPNQYTVTFKVDGEVYKTFTQDYGTAITIPETPTKEGYSFSGWQNVANTVPAEDVTYEATFSINKYTLKFVADGNVVSETSVDYGSNITTPTAPVKEGYSFVAWGDVAATMPACNVTYTAEYKINQYTLKFMSDGQVVSETSVDFATAITAPQAPAKEGYSFVSWGDVAETMPAKDVTYTAQYKVNQYTVTFKIDGEVFKTLTQDYGSNITIPAAPTKEGYSFSGWQNVASTVPAQDVTYDANFTVNNYTLKFVADGTVVSEKSVDYGSAITAPNAPAKTGYTFVSWGNVAATMPANDVTYTAQYSINQYTVTFKVDGEVFKTLTQDYGSTISIPAAPTKEGYSFSGWQNVVKTVPAEDVVYEANFTVNQYTLKFVADGIVVSEKSMDYGSTINIPQAPAKEGYSFMSWGNVAETMPAKNVTYTAEYKVNQYKLTYLIDGRVYKTYMIDFDSKITPEDETEDDDYYYGWEDVPETMPAHDVEVNAYITKILGWAKSIDKNTTIYTVDGQKILIPQKGNIYIINGKKVKF